MNIYAPTTKLNNLQKSKRDLFSNEANLNQSELSERHCISYGAKHVQICALKQNKIIHII